MCYNVIFNVLNTTALMLNNQAAYFRTTVGVCQGCPLSPVLFDIFLENIILEALLDHHTFVSIGERPIRNLRFDDEVLVGSNKELQDQCCP